MMNDKPLEGQIKPIFLGSSHATERHGFPSHIRCQVKEREDLKKFGEPDCSGRGGGTLEDNVDRVKSSLDRYTFALSKGFLVV